jgi:uncharacterized protein (DUF1499 family)
MDALIGVFVICCMSVLSPFSGVSENELRGCAPSPNCISSQSWRYDFIHHTDPILYKSTRQEAFRKIKDFMTLSENIYIAEIKEDEYIRVTYFTKVFRFPDRVELYFPPDSDIVQIRSHSWIGFWDVFANRRRAAKLENVINSPDPPTRDAIL